jgi:transcriptional regulator with XRE-family HTH domain
MADRTGMDRAMIRRLENGQLGNPTLATVGHYARALGKHVVVTLVDAAANSRGPTGTRPVDQGGKSLALPAQGRWRGRGDIGADRPTCATS